MPRNQQPAAQKQKKAQAPNKHVNGNGTTPQKPAPRRRVAPASIRKETDGAAIAEQSGIATMKENKGAPHIELEVRGVEPVAHISRQKAAMEAFLHEKVKVQIQDVDDPQADPRFVIAVNGRKQIFERGREYLVPRYIVEGLARAKPIGYKNEEYTKQDGVRDVRWPAKRGLRYPFSVMEDPSGERGREWLRNVLKQP